VQLQINYLDWESAGIQSHACYDVAVKHGKKVVVMEGVKGGTLAKVPEEVEQKMKAVHADWTPAQWAIKFAATQENVMVVLSGMSNLEQMEMNSAFMKDFVPLNADELEILAESAEIIRQRIAIPCTGCRYCVEGCPMGLSIPTLLSTYNEMKTGAGLSPIMYLEGLPEEKRPHACIACGACAEACPQNIEIPDVMAELADIYDHSKKWSEICKEREEAAKALKEAKK
jgi:predicted aldo/keto reductase-like oxidoreductase